jgi:hypothetical protein
MDHRSIGGDGRHDRRQAITGWLAITSASMTAKLFSKLHNYLWPIPVSFVRGRIAGMKHNKLRIAWSVALAVVAVLVLVLWARSYSLADSVAYDSPGVSRSLNSSDGHVIYAWSRTPIPLHTCASKWQFTTQPLVAPPRQGSIFGQFVWIKYPNLMGASAPDWSVLIALCAAGALSWLP